MPKARRSKASGIASDVLPLFEFSNVVNSSIDLNFILGTVLLTVMGKMLVSKGAVLLKRKENSFEIVAAKGMGELLGKSTPLDHQPRTIRDLKRSTKKTDDFFSMQEVRLVVPIVSERKTTGYLALGNRLGKKSYSASDKKLITSLVNLSASAVEKAVMLDRLKEAHRNLDRKLQELKTLFELSKEFNLVLDAEKVIRLLTFSLLGQVGVNRYAVCLVEGAAMRIAASRMEDSAELLQALQKLCELGSPALVEDLAKDHKVSGAAEQLLQVGVKLVIPMQVQSRTKGLILLGQKLGGSAYSKGDLEFLYSLGNLAIISIENARLFQETLEKQRLEDELKIAREIQQGLLPQKLPQIPGYDLAAVNVSSKQVGGDYYDVLPRSQTEYVIAIGDVSGKGTPAALLMANVQAAMRALAPIHGNLPETTARINDITFENTGGDKFITFFWGIVNTESRQFRYVNAGHNLPFLIRKDGSVLRLSEGGLILGIMKTMQPYKEGFVQLESGDTLFLFTDGVSEAMNAVGEDFTEERLEELVGRLCDRTAREMIQEVHSAIDDFCKGTQQSDDITMLVLKLA